MNVQDPGSGRSHTGVMPEEEPFRFESRIAVVLREDLLPWQELNIVAFLASGITASAPDLTGEPYEDADGNRYLAMLRG